MDIYSYFCKAKPYDICTLSRRDGIQEVKVTAKQSLTLKPVILSSTGNRGRVGSDFIGNSVIDAWILTL